jgi:hypothetical protein
MKSVLIIFFLTHGSLIHLHGAQTFLKLTVAHLANIPNAFTEIPKIHCRVTQQSTTGTEPQRISPHPPQSFGLHFNIIIIHTTKSSHSPFPFRLLYQYLACICLCPLHKQTPWPLVRKRTIPPERSPLVGEI